MSSISMELLKKLRSKTGAGLMECRKALTKHSDIEQAALYLKQYGMSHASKTRDRTAKEGIVVVCAENEDKNGVIVEFNCETDFVSNNQVFQESCFGITKKLLDCDAKTTEELSSGTNDVTDKLDAMILSFKENIKLRRFAKMNVSEGLGKLFYYVHHGSSVGVILKLLVLKDDTLLNPVFLNLGKNLCMHVVAMGPSYLNQKVCDKVLVQKRNTFADEARKAGKPENILNRIVDGKLKQFVRENVLMDQLYFKEEEYTVSKWLESVGLKLSDKLILESFVRFKVGEDIAS